MTELKRSRKMRMDGRLINLVLHRRHLPVCSKVCGIPTLADQAPDDHVRLSFESVYDGALDTDMGSQAYTV